MIGLMKKRTRRTRRLKDKKQVFNDEMMNKNLKKARKERDIMLLNTPLNPYSPDYQDQRDLHRLCFLGLGQASKREMEKIEKMERERLKSGSTAKRTRQQIEEEKMNKNVIMSRQERDKNLLDSRPLTPDHPDYEHQKKLHRICLPQRNQERRRALLEGMISVIPEETKQTFGHAVSSAQIHNRINEYAGSLGGRKKKYRKKTRKKKTQN